MKILFSSCCKVRLFKTDDDESLVCTFTGVPGDIIDFDIPSDCFVEFLPFSSGL